MSKQDAIPAGSRPPQDEGHAPAEPTNPAASDDKPKHESYEDLQKAYQNLESKLGEQGTLIGELRAQAQAPPTEPETPAEPAVDYGAKMAELLKQVDEGEIDTGEAMRQHGELVQAQTLEMASAKFAEASQESEAKKQYQQFLKDNPDFTELQNSGALDALRRENPLHDNLSAYYAYKGAAEKDAAFEAGKAEMAKLKQGAAPTGQVLQKPGQTARQTNPQKGPVSADEQTQLMMDALGRSRAG